MKLPRDLGGEELARILKKYNFQVTRQSGSHAIYYRKSDKKRGLFYMEVI